MPLMLRIILLLGAVWLLSHVLRSVRRSGMKTTDSFSWIALAVLFVVLAVFPHLLIALAKWIGVDSPANLLFLLVTFLLIIKIFSMDRKIAKLQQQMLEMVQRTAIKECEEGESPRGSAQGE